MKKTVLVWSILISALFMLTVSFGGSLQTAPKLVKVGGEKNHCDCSYRIQ